MLFGLFLAAVALAAPEPIDPVKWVKPDDFISPSLGTDQGFFWLEVAVDPTGKPFGCRKLLGNGHSSLERQMCRRILERATFTPAHDASGAAVAGTHRHGMAMWLNGQAPADKLKPIPIPVDAAIPISKLPKGAKRDVEVMTLEDERGRVQKCAVRRSSNNDALDRAACDQLSKASFDALLGADGRAVPAVRSRAIEFRP